MGLAQRELEEAGITTITVSNIPELTAAVGAPRIAAIEHPIGRTMGMPGDVERQRAVLRATLVAVERIMEPGGVKHLPFDWPETPQGAQAHPAEPPPIVRHLKRHPWQLPRLLSRQVPRGSR